MKRHLLVPLLNEGQPGNASADCPFGVKTYIDDMGESHWYNDDLPATDSQEAIRMARQWACQTHGNMAIAYNRATRAVIAQFYQSANGELGFLLYGSPGAVVQHQNVQFFEVASLHSEERAPGSIPPL